MDHNEFRVVDVIESHKKQPKKQKRKLVWDNPTVLIFLELCLEELANGNSVRYHLPDFQRAHTQAMREPRGFKEIFNYRHSSLRNVIERTFGVWKARWALLREMHHNMTFEHQVKIVMASMAVHNYIRRTGTKDEAFNMAQQESYIPRQRGGTSNEAQEERTRTRRTNDDDTYMAAIRDIIAEDIMKS